MIREANKTAESARPRIVVLGAGGHGKVVLDALLAARTHDIIGVLDADPARKGERLLGVEILGGDDLLANLVLQGLHYCAIGIGGNRSNALRRRIYESARAAGASPALVIHPSARVSPWANLGEGSFVACGAQVLPGTSVGVNVIINSRASVDHDCLIEDHVHIAPGATLCGNIRVGEGSHIGAGAVVRQNITIGRNCLIAAGAVVVRDVADGDQVRGCPARPVAQR